MLPVTLRHVQGDLRGGGEARPQRSRQTPSTATPIFCLGFRGCPTSTSKRCPRAKPVCRRRTGSRRGRGECEGSPSEAPRRRFVGTREVSLLNRSRMRSGSTCRNSQAAIRGRSKSWVFR
jgi:hypothetical protein